MNIVQIAISDTISIHLLILLLCQVQFHALMGDKTGRAMKIVIYATGIASFVDMITSIVEGRPGPVYYFLNYYGNTILFALPVIIAWYWIAFIDLFYEGMNEKEDGTFFWDRLTFLPGILVLGMCVLQLFKPVLFTVDENNIYHRFSLSWIPVAVSLFYIAFGFLRFYYQKENRRFRTGNIILFFAPIIIGTFFQFYFNGVSTIFPSIAIGLTGFSMSCNNELLMRDWLTGLLNRTCFLSARTRRFFRDHKNIGIMLLDIDDFKSINDRFGHLEGDRCLQDLANILSEEADRKDMVFRFSGDEFLIISFFEDPDHLQELGRMIRDRLKKRNEGADRPFPLKVSFGTAWGRTDSADIDSIVRRADAAMYEMKNRKQPAIKRK